jgi:hypothetical protein
MRTSLLFTALVCGACSSEASSLNRLPAQPAEVAPCGEGAIQSCSCSDRSGLSTCRGGAFGACECSAEPSDFENPTAPAPMVDAGNTRVPEPRPECSPGFYLGTYSCELTIGGLPVPLEGDVSFNLSINEMIVPGECEASDEFCSDLVISENGGTLYGIAFGFYAFETQLTGALDCATGEFRAMGLGGRWGTAISSDPNDPDALWTIEEPAAGSFDGELDGLHALAGGTESIAGDWFLRDAVNDLTCTGPFTVTLQP